MIGRNTALAADAQHRDARDEVQGGFRFHRGQRQGKVCGVFIICGFHPGRRRALYGPGAGKMHGAARQQCAAYQLNAPRLGHRAVLALGPFIHGKHTVGIGGRGDDRHRAADFRQPPGQVIGTAQVAG